MHTTVGPLPQLTVPRAKTTANFFIDATSSLPVWPILEKPLCAPGNWLQSDPLLVERLIARYHGFEWHLALANVVEVLYGGK